MDVCTVDFESAWSADYSLTKLSYIEYIKDLRFQIISCSIKLNGDETQVYFGETEVGNALRAIDWTKTAAIAHNGNEFDHAILAWVFDVHPVLFIDTLCMARPLHQSSVGGSLKALSEHYGLAQKDNTILLATKGKRLEDFDIREMVQMARYNKGDSDNTYALFNILKKSTSRRELLLSDMTARMNIYPQFRCDTQLLADTLVKAQAEKEALLEGLCEPLGCIDTIGVRTELASAKKFASALLLYGVEAPMKISKTTGKPTYALAKSDEDFVALQDHPEPAVQMLVSARLGGKSTLLETRLALMKRVGDALGGWIVAPLAHHAATTGRWGGRVWNPQNLFRINKKKPKLSDALRKSLVAPPGYKVVACDLSGIELRVNHYLWNVPSSMALYADDPEADLYKEFAAVLYGKPIDEITDEERQVAKVAQLGLGFGAGAVTFRRVAKNMGGVVLDQFESQRVVDTWRAKYVEIHRGWKRCQQALAAMLRGQQLTLDPRGLVLTGQDFIQLPSGRKLHYPNLRQEVDKDNGRLKFVYGFGKKTSTVRGPLIDENIVQAIARDVIGEQALSIKKLTGREPALMVHDELVYLVKEEDAAGFLDLMNRVMRTTPSWLPGIVLWSEGKLGGAYGDCK